MSMMDGSQPLAPARYVTIKLAHAVTGLSEKAMRRKIERREWVEGRQYRRRDGRVFIDLVWYERWVEGAPGRRK